MQGLTILAAAFTVVTPIVWWSLRLGIAPMPSAPHACQAMLRASRNAPDGPIADLGSGWGTLAIAFARQYPDRQVIGYELSWVPWLVSLALKHLLRLRNLTFRREDFFSAPMPEGALVLCYLFPNAMGRVEQRILRGCWAPAVVISNTFAFPSMKTRETVALNDLYRTCIHVYHFTPDIDRAERIRRAGPRCNATTVETRIHRESSMQAAPHWASWPRAPSSTRLARSPRSPV